MIALTGAAGHTGGYVALKLRQLYPNEQIRCIVRRVEQVDFLESIGLECLQGDLAREQDILKLINGSRVVVHIANIRYSPEVVLAALQANVQHVVLVHTTGMFSKYRGYAIEYERIEKEVLDLLSGSACSYTVIRPTMIYGGWQDHNLHKLITILNRVPLFPVFGTGTGRMQPVHVEDLADSIVATLDNPQATNRSFNISGGSVHTYREILYIIQKLLNRTVLLVTIPYTLSLVLVWVMNLVARGPVTVEQVRRLREDKVFDHSDARSCLKYHPRTLETGLRQQVTEMGLMMDNS